MDVSMALHIKLCTEMALNCDYGLCFNISFKDKHSMLHGAMATETATVRLRAGAGELAG
jgi:hypothetical protein